MNKEKITGVILAGGKNSRMGSDKGMLTVDGKKIIERILDAMKPVVDEIIIISNEKNYDYLGYKVYNDIIKECGPMGGIHAALSFSATEKNLIVACDMPFITSSVLKQIINNSTDCGIAVPEFLGEAQPLCGVYSKSCLSKFVKLLKKGNWKMKDAFNYFKVNNIRFTKDELPENHFLNLNTPVEYQTIKQTENEYFN
ncbi:MAG: molybdenum cofactor guanylyltransferase [Bacteroidota bacterium]